MSADDDVNGLLAGASKTMAGARSCWLVTSTRDGGVDARPMGRLQAEPGDDAWLIRFITDSRSHKAADIRRAAKVANTFEVPVDDAYVTLVGRAAVKDSAADGIVTLPWGEREGSAAQDFSGCCDGGPPCVHR